MRAKEAKKILPKSEYEAFEALLLRQSSKMGPAALMKKASLSRKLRDKYKDLARFQAHAVRDRRTNETDTDLNQRKARIFQELIEQIESQLEECRQSRTENGRAQMLRAREQLGAERRRLKEIRREVQKRSDQAQLKKTMDEARRRER